MQEVYANGIDGLANVGDLVAGQIVYHHDLLDRRETGQSRRECYHRRLARFSSVTQAGARDKGRLEPGTDEPCQVLHKLELGT